jgi:hypothetical protein
MAKMAKMSSKMAKYGSGSGSGSGLFTNLVMLAIYVVAAYILYRVVMYFLNMRSSAMPNIPDSSSKDRNRDGKQMPKCSSGTCDGN